MEQPVAPIESKPLHHISVMPGFGYEVGSRALQDAVVHKGNQQIKIGALTYGKQDNLKNSVIRFRWRD
jgi:hypothetical protein